MGARRRGKSRMLEIGLATLCLTCIFSRLRGVATYICATITCRLQPELPILFNVCTHPLLGVDLFWIILSGMESWDFIVDGVKYETMVSASL